MFKQNSFYLAFQKPFNEMKLSILGDNERLFKIESNGEVKIKSSLKPSTDTVFKVCNLDT